VSSLGALRLIKLNIKPFQRALSRALVEMYNQSLEVIAEKTKRVKSKDMALEGVEDVLGGQAVEFLKAYDLNNLLKSAPLRDILYVLPEINFIYGQKHQEKSLLENLLLEADPLVKEVCGFIEGSFYRNERSNLQAEVDRRGLSGDLIVVPNLEPQLENIPSTYSVYLQGVCVFTYDCSTTYTIDNPDFLWASLNLKDRQ